MFTLYFIVAVVAINAITSTMEMQYESQYQIQETKAGSNTAILEDCKSDPQSVVEYYNVNETQYLFFSQQVTWDEARVLCSYYNAKLASLDTMEKATRIAELIADSNLEIEKALWLGGRRLGNTWSWMYNRVGSQKNEIPVQSNIEDYPPWAREPSRPMKDCLAIDRRAHSYPNFVDLDCRLQRPFICEKRPEDGAGKPIPSKWVRIQRHTYTFYHAKFTWEEAVMYCRLTGARLAIMTNSDVIEILASIMTKARPDFETVWIGAHYTYGQLMWLSTGTSLEPAMDESRYSPRISDKSEKKDGCLLLDRHLDNTPSFVETQCDRKRDFICEEYPKDELYDWLNEPIKFTYDDSIYVIYPLEKTWQESNAFCNEQGSVLAYMNDINVTNLIVEAMGDHPKDISHVWIGGNLIKNEWQWTQSGQIIANEKDSSGFPPWTNMNDEELDRYTGHTSTCLNLDRSDHVRPYFYGLDCAIKQSFVCKIMCNVTPPVNNGNWICENTPDGLSCELRCDDGFMTMGIKKIFCTHQHGWNTVKNWLEIPLCLALGDYVNRIVRSLDHDLQNSAGYYFILDHANEKMQSLSLLFTQQVLNIFPINYNLKMGIYCTNPPIQLPFNQTDTCTTLSMINNAMKNEMDDQLDSNTWHKQLSVYKGSKIVIFIIIDVDNISRYLEILARMKTSGNRIVVIGLEDNWEILLDLASIGFDRHKNLYLFDNRNLMGFETIINELHSFKKTLKCPQEETDLTHSVKNNSTASSGSDKNQDQVTRTKSQEQVSSGNENSKDQGLELEKQSS